MKGKQFLKNVLLVQGLDQKEFTDPGCFCHFSNKGWGETVSLELVIT